MKRTAAFLILLTAVLMPMAPAAERPTPWTPRKWIRTAGRISRAAVCATQTADMLSSYRDSHIAGLHETNGFFTPGGNFSMGRMIAVKSGICAAFLMGPHFTGGSEAATLTWATIGAGVAVPTAYAAINNMRLK